MKKNGSFTGYAMKRVALPLQAQKAWLFEPAKRPDDTADHCLDCSFPPPVQAPGIRLYI